MRLLLLRLNLPIFFRSKLCCRYCTAKGDAFSYQSGASSVHEENSTNDQKLAADVDSNLHSGAVHYNYRTIGTISSLVLRITTIEGVPSTILGKCYCSRCRSEC